VDRSIHTAAAQQGTVGSIDNGANLFFGNITGFYYDFLHCYTFMQLL
jgi:hypothetical protein